MQVEGWMIRYRIIISINCYWSIEKIVKIWQYFICIEVILEL